MSKSIINCENGEVIVRELSAEELAQQAIDQATTQAEAELKAAELAAKAQARQAILDRLGLTEEEARLLLG
jgi:hypothetical protein